jgi:uncharacterized protein YxeA
MASTKQNSKAMLIITIVVVILIAAAVAIYNSNSGNSSQTSGQVAGISSNKSDNKNSNNPKTNIEKTYAAKAIDMNGKQSKSNVEMSVKYAEKADEILIKGTPATAKSGSKFLVLQVELKNNSNERLIVAPLDLLRLVVDDQKRAAEIYTEELQRIKGSVVIEPDSTKVTRIGFVLTPDIVNKALKLQIGEVNEANKELIDIKI